MQNPDFSLAHQSIQDAKSGERLGLAWRTVDDGKLEGPRLLVSEFTRDVVCEYPTMQGRKANPALCLILVSMAIARRWPG